MVAVGRIQDVPVALGSEPSAFALQSVQVKALKVVL